MGRQGVLGSSPSGKWMGSWGKATALLQQAFLAIQLLLPNLLKEYL